MCKTTRLYMLVLAAVIGMAGLSAHAAPVAAHTQVDVMPVVQISHDLRVTSLTTGHGYETGTALALGVVSSTVPFTSLNLKWDRSINPQASGDAREAYAVNPSTGRKIPVSFEVMSHDRMVDAGNDSVNVIFDDGSQLSSYSYSVILTHGETLFAGTYPVGVLADVTVA
ncbi:TPA: hypothetical protein G8V61_004097 [Salmonella enterica]|nr:hypothetical protein [Salmonella enterica]